MVTRRRAPGFTSYRRGYGPGAAYTAQLGPPGTGTELKAVDARIYVDFNLNTGNIVEIPLPIQGSTFYGRIANRTRGVSIEIRGSITTTTTNTSTYVAQLGRIIVVYDRQPNGIVPPLTSIFEDRYYDGTTSTNEFSKLNLVNRDRFLILRDRQVYLSPLEADGEPPSTNPQLIVNDPNAATTPGIMYHEFINLKGLQTQYQTSTNGSTQDVSTGAYYLICMDNSTGNSAYQLFCSARYKYYD